MSQLVQKFGTLQESYGKYYTNLDDLEVRLRGKCDILTDDKGNLVAFYRNRGLFPTESRTELALERFRKEGAEITRIGNEVANTNNRNFMLGLVEFQLHVAQDGIENTEDGQRVVPYSEIEIIPVTVRVTGKEHVGFGDNQEVPAILWKEKDSSGAPEPGNSVDNYWKEDFPYHESQMADWRVIFINPNPKDGDITKVFPAWDMRNYPGVGLGRFFERRLPRPGEPPPGPLPPNWNHSQR